jgi:hypothetical protein
MKSLFVKQFMNFLRANDTNIRWFARIMQRIRNGRGKNKITTDTIYEWLESEKKLLKIDQKVVAAMIAFEEELQHNPEIYMPEPCLSEALITDHMNHMKEKGEVVQNENGTYSLSKRKSKVVAKHRKTYSRSGHNKSR